MKPPTPFLKRPKTRQLKNGVWLQLAWHYGRQCFTAEIHIAQQSRHFWSETRKDLMAQVRLALSRGTDNIYWDVEIMHRLTR